MKKKIILITLLCSLFIISSLIGILFIKDVNAISDLDFQFQNDYIYNSDDLDYDTFNIRNKSEYTDYYNATYSFENEVGKIETDISWISVFTQSDPIYNIEIIDNFDSHDSVLWYNCSGETGTNIMTYSYFKNSIQIGIIEYWIYFSDYGTGTVYMNIKDNETKGISYSYSTDINVFRIQYASTNIEIEVSANTWIHNKFSFDTNSDTFSFWLNNINYLTDVDFQNSENSFGLDYIRFNSFGANYRTEWFIDAVGYSWDGYNATYTFEGEVDLVGENIGFIDYYVDTGGLIIIKDNFNGHYEVLKYSKTTDNPLNGYNYFDSKTSGIVEFYWSISANNKRGIFQLLEDSTNGIYLRFDNDGDLKYYDGSWHLLLASYNTNQLYHVKIEFDLTTGNPFTNWFKCWIDNDYKGKFIDGFYGNPDFIDTTNLNGYDDSYNMYFDAIGYSWDTEYYIGKNLIHYTIGQNIIPYLEINTSIKEINTCEFAYNLTTFIPNTLDCNTIDNNWIENDDATNTHVKTSGAYDEIDIDYQMTQDQDTYGIYKEFGYNAKGIFNMSFYITFMSLNNPHLDGWYFDIYSYDDTLLVSLLFNLTNPPDISLYYYNGSNYVYIHEIQSLFDFSFNIYIDSWIILKLNDVDIIYSWNFPKLTSNIGINTIEVIGGNAEDIGDMSYIVIDSIGLYINGSSYLPDDLSSTNINTDIEQWNDNIHNLFEIIGLGYFSFSVFYGGIYQDTIISYSEFDDTLKRIHYTDDNIFKGSELYEFVLISNVSFTISEIKVYGNILKESSNIYRPTFTYANVDIQDNYFYVKNNRLYFIHDANESGTLEYIQAKFEIDDTYAINRSINFQTYFIGISKAYFKTNYISETNSTFVFKLGHRTYNNILPQQQIIESFTILITDNDNDNYYGNSEGYISSLKLIYYPDIEITILTLSLVEIMIPLMVLIIPTLAIASVYGKKAVIPMLILMTVICFIADLIGMEMFFIIMLCLGSALFLQYKREREKS